MMNKQNVLKKAFSVSAQIGKMWGKASGYTAVKTFLHRAQQFAVCAILARSSILNGYAPFGAAMVGAVCTVSGGFAAILGAFLGYLVLSSTVGGVGAAAAALLIVAFRHVFADFDFVTGPWFMPCVTTASLAACEFVFLPPMHFTAAIMFMCMLMLTFGCTYFYRILLQPPREEGILRPTALLVLLATVLLSVSDITIGGIISPARICALVLVMGAAYTGGSAIGAAAGVALGITMDTAYGNGALFTCTYGFGALIGGGFRSMQRQIFAAVYLCAGTAAALLGAQTSVFVSAIGEGILAAIVFAAVPETIWLYLRETMIPRPRELSEAVRRVQIGARRYAAEAAQAFYDLYLSMSSGMRQGKHAANEDTREVFDRAAEKVCCKCSLCGSCWERNYINTLSALNDVSVTMMQRGRVYAADFPTHFSARCIQFPEFVQAVNETLAVLQQRREYEAKCEENRSLLAQQYAGLTGILRRLGNDLSQEVTTLPAREKQVRRYAAAFGQIEQVAVYRDGNGRLRIELGGTEVTTLLQQKEGFTAGLSALLGIGLTLPEKICDELGVRLLLREQAAFRVVVGMAQRKKKEESVSGDTGRYFMTENGQACLMLSDGMGTGEQAAQDSGAVIEQMERFLRAGVEIREILHTIAPAFRLQSDGMRFVTLDLLTVDLYTGRAESVKCGAAPSYMQTGGGLTRLMSQSLPIGLEENSAAAESVPLRFSHGDVYVMLSDGITDGVQDSWIVDKLNERTGDSPKELAQQLMAAAKERGSQDDMTVMVLRVERVHDKETYIP